jgi:hypothetical protein
MNNKQIDQMVEKTISFYIVIYKIVVGLSSTPQLSAQAPPPPSRGSRLFPVVSWSHVNKTEFYQ